MIYDNFLDDALELCICCIKKFPSSAILKAAKCYVLVELGKVDEASSISKSLLQGKPIIDKRILGFLDRVFMKLEDHSSSYAMLERSFKHSRTEELANWWFMVSLRGIEEDDGLSLLKSAMSIFSNNKKKFYQFWIIISLIIRDLIIPPNDIPSSNMKLANKHAAQIIENNPDSLSKDEIELLLLIFERNSEHKISLSLAQKSNDIPYYNNVISQLLLDNGETDELVSFIKEEFSKNGISDFKLWELLMEVLDYESLVYILSSIPKSDKRTLYLARTRLEIKFGTTNVIQSLVEYLEFGKDKPFCFLDFKSIIKMLNSDLRESLFQYCKEKMDLIFIKIQRELRPDDFDYVKMLLLLPRYSSEVSLNVAIFKLDKDITFTNLIECIPIVENVISKDSGNFIAKLLLMLLWIRLGLLNKALDIFTSLDIKQIQLDTLSYLVSEYLVDIGIHNVLEEESSKIESFYNGAMRFYMENKHNSHRVLNDSLSKRQLLTLTNIFDFNNRLQFSIQRFSTISALIRLDLLKLDLVSIKDFLGEFTVEPLTKGLRRKLKDNRDFDVVSIIGCREDLFCSNDLFLIDDYLFIRNCCILLKSLCFGGDDCNVAIETNDSSISLLSTEGFKLIGTHKEWDASLLKKTFSLVEKNHLASLAHNFQGTFSDDLFSCIKENVEWIDCSILDLEPLFNDSTVLKSIKESWIHSLNRMKKISLFDLSILCNK